MKARQGWLWNHLFFADVDLGPGPWWRRQQVGVRVVYRVAEACPGTAITRVGPVRVFDLDGEHDRSGSVVPEDLRRLERLADGDELERVRAEVAAEVLRGSDLPSALAMAQEFALVSLDLEVVAQVLKGRLELLKTARGRLGGRPVVASTVDLGAA